MATVEEILSLRFQTDGIDGVNAAQKAFRDAGLAGLEATPQLQGLVDEFAKLSGQNNLIASLTQEKVALAETGDALALAKIRLGELQTQLAATATPSATLERAFAKQTSTVATLDAQYNQHQANLTRTSNALQAAGIDTANLDSEQRKIQASLGAVASEASNVGRSMETVAASTEQAAASAAHGESLFGGLKTQLAAIVSIAAVAEVALKAIQFGADSLKGAEQVEQSLARVQALAGSAATSFADLDGTVEHAAVAVNTSTQAAASGLAALVSQGLSADTAMKVLIPTLQLAKIANTDVNAAAADVAQTLKAFNIPASEAGAVVDQLTVASHGASGGLSAMANAAAQLAPDAKALGLNFTQTVSVLGLLESKGLDTEKAVRGLRTIFQDLETPTSTLRQQLLALGDGTSDFNTAVTTLTAGTPRAQDALLTLDGPARSLIETLGQAGPQALAQFTEGLNNSAGAASKTSTAIDSTLSGSFTKFTNAIDLIGEKLAAPILQPFAAEFSKLADEINKFSESDDFKTISDSVSRMATSAAKAFDKLITNTDFKSFGKNAVADLDGLSKSLSALADNATTVATVIGKAGDVIGGTYHAVATTIDVTKGAIAGLDGVLAKGSAKLVGVLSGVSTTAKTASAAMDNYGEALIHVGGEAIEDATDHARALTGDVKDLAGVTDEATDATKKQGAAAADSAPEVQKHADATKNAAAASVQLTATLAPVGPATAAVGAAAQKTSSQLLELAQQGKLSAKDLQGAFVGLGIQSQQALEKAATDAKNFFTAIDLSADNSAKGNADRQNAFLAYAAKALAASAQLDDGTKQSVQAQLESKASILGVSDALTQLENTSASSSAALVSDSDRDAAALKQVGDAALAASLAHQRAAHQQQQDTTDNIQTTKEQVQANNAAEVAYTEYSDAANAAALATRGITADTSHADDGMQRLTQAIGEARAGYLAVSTAAASFYDNALKGAFDQALANDDAGAGFDRVAEAITNAAAATDQALAQQRTELTNQINSINQLGTAAHTSFSEFGSDAGEAAQKMTALADEIQQGKYQAGLLGQTDLAPLQQALEAAAERAQQLADAAKSAVAQLADANNELLDSIDDANGNATDKENRRYAEQLQQLKDLAAQAGAAGQAQYQLAIKHAQDLHELNLQNIQQENDAKNDTGSGSSTSAPAASSGGGIVPTRYVLHSFALPTGKVSALVPENQSGMYEDFVRTLVAQKVNSI